MFARTSRPRKLHFVQNWSQLEPRQLLSTLEIQGPGPIHRLIIGSDATFQVQQAGAFHGSVFPNANVPGDAGFFVRPRLENNITGPVVGLDLQGRRAAGLRTTAALARSHSWHPILFQRSDDGNSALLVADNRRDGNTWGLEYQLVQITRYLTEVDAFRVDATLINLGLTTLVVDAFAAADLFVDDRNPGNDHLPVNDDFGFGLRDDFINAIGGTDLTGTHRFFVAPNSFSPVHPTAYQQGHFNAIWTAIGAGSHLNNTVLLRELDPPTTDDPNFVNSGAAIQWQSLLIAAGASVRLSYYWSFGDSASRLLEEPPSAVPVNVESVAQVQFLGPVATFTSPMLAGQAADFRATVHWGDGSRVETARVERNPHGAGFLVVGEHLYAQAGEYPITVTVIDANGGATTVQGVATIRASGEDDVPRPGVPLTAQLDPESDRGVRNDDGITNENRPRFLGQAHSGARVTLTFSDITSSQSFAFQTTAGLDGAWSLRPHTSIPDGSYVTKAEVEPSASPTQSITIFSSAQPLIIDTMGPRISGLHIKPRQGRIEIQLSDDRAGIDGSELLNSDHYRLILRTPRGPRRLGMQAKAVVGARVVLATTRLAASRAYILSILPTIRDRAGNALDGHFQGRFPSGDGRNGTLFEARLHTSPTRLLRASRVGNTA